MGQIPTQVPSHAVVALDTEAEEIARLENPTVDEVIALIEFVWALDRPVQLVVVGSGMWEEIYDSTNAENLGAEHVTEIGRRYDEAVGLV